MLIPQVVDLLEARVLEGRGEPVPYLQAVFKGSPCDTKIGLERRTFVFKHAIQILSEGDLSNKVLCDIILYGINNLCLLFCLFLCIYGDLGCNCHLLAILMKHYLFTCFKIVF